MIRLNEEKKNDKLKLSFSFGTAIKISTEDIEKYVYNNDLKNHFPEFKYDFDLPF